MVDFEFNGRGVHVSSSPAKRRRTSKVAKELETTKEELEEKRDLNQGWKDVTDDKTVIGIRLFGALDHKPFLIECYKKYSSIKDA
ncbi:hypothetical protein GIB67_006676 [Kingdonia uniflora]|uniref:Uncharacterized protein n=1 Tax=Kingdonia uniflora TaxID=39325 RepID=A0A7J7LAZ1_9MAGN|nr:hypothetical protein GIB67_006676 [Kingdonia uniflora]